MSRCALAVAALLVFTTSAQAEPPAAQIKSDIAAARAVFDKNIKAIQDKNREAYLACYRPDERLVRAGLDGVKTGYQDFAQGVSPTGSKDWPSMLKADDVQLHWVAPGVVYGIYRYTVTTFGKTTTGISERVFLKSNKGWHIAVTTAFEGDKPKPEKK